MTPLFTLDTVVQNAAVFLLVFARTLALVLTVPLLSGRTVPGVAKIALAGYIAFLIFPQAIPNLPAAYGRYGAFNLAYLLFMLGEGAIGVITGLFVSIIFAAFSSAGQFFSFQTGLGASEVYDTLSQVENPLMGQFLNLMAMCLFLQVQGFQRLFLGGTLRSWQSLNVGVLVNQRDSFYRFLLSGLSNLFFDALVIALPVMGVLFLVSLTMGLLSKAAPQMNLLSEGLPITILTAFFILTWLLPSLCEFFVASFDRAFMRLEQLFAAVGGIP
ncbi:MAG: flagellar biosynthetic protein FliR [Spirochaetaceae bacterium]|jgi:flagellar biosynthetic protein FliR|nr:flagellar biosynthetic protein FliR [Spirochaetaceae bacterium]